MSELGFLPKHLFGALDTIADHLGSKVSAGNEPQSAQWVFDDEIRAEMFQTVADHALPELKADLSEEKVKDWEYDEAGNPVSFEVITHWRITVSNNWN